MKIKILPSLSFSCLIVGVSTCLKLDAQPSVIADTNTYSFNMLNFIPDEHDVNYENREGFYYLYRHLHNEPIPETLPTASDDSGNWGTPIDGLGLSIRFRQQEFITGDPVVAVIIIRNLDSHPRTVNLNEYNYKITLSCGTNTFLYGKAAPPRELSTEDSGQFQGYINEKSEGLLVMNISRMFDLKHLGEYSVQVQIHEPARDGKGMTNIISEKAKFKIVEKLSDSEVAIRKAYEDRSSGFQQQSTRPANHSN